MFCGVALGFLNHPAEALEIRFFDKVMEVSDANLTLAEITTKYGSIEKTGSSSVVVLLRPSRCSISLCASRTAAALLCQGILTAFVFRRGEDWVSKRQKKHASDTVDEPRNILASNDEYAKKLMALLARSVGMSIFLQCSVLIW